MNYRIYDIQPRENKERFYERITSTPEFKKIATCCINRNEGELEIFSARGVAVIIEIVRLGKFYFPDVTLIGKSRRIKKTKSKLEEKTGFKLEEING